MAAHAEQLDHGVHEHPPEPHYSSRISPSVLGMFLFIGSEIMLFGAFFTAYFFVRVVAGTPWPTPPFHLPVFVALINTCILVTSSFTMHWALQSIKRGNVFGLRAGLLLTFLMGLTFLVTQGREYSRVGFATKDGAFATIFFCLTGLHGAHVFVGLSILLFMTIRAFRGHFSPGTPSRRRDRRDLLALRRRDVDRRVPDRLHPLMRNPLRSEAEAFRFLLVVIVGALVIVGAVVPQHLARRRGRGARGRRHRLVAHAGGDARGRRARAQGRLVDAAAAAHRVLVVAMPGTSSVTVAADATEIVVTVPALASKLEAATGAVDDRRADAEQTALSLTRRLSRPGVSVRGEVGADDPWLATEDALRTFGADADRRRRRPRGRANRSAAA